MIITIFKLQFLMQWYLPKIFSVNVIQENLDRSDAPSAQSGDESVWSVDETGNVDYAEATQQFLVEIT